MLGVDKAADMWYSIMAHKRREPYAAVVESADTRDLKSLGSNTVPVQVRSAAPFYTEGKFNIAEWSSPVARRAHNPKVVGSNPASATSEVYD